MSYPNVVPLPRPTRPVLEPFRPFYASQLEGQTTPPPEWLVDGVFLRGTVALLTGAPKLGKTLIMQQLLTATALGMPWLGHETTQVRSFGLFCEDNQRELERRETAILAHYERSAADLEIELSWESRDGKDAVLVEFDRWGTKPKYTPLWEQLWDHVEEDAVGIVGIDTAGAVFAGNEVSREQVTRFMRELQRRAIAMNGVVVLTAHPSKLNPNGYSGTTAWLASARTGLSLGRPVDFDQETGEPAGIRVLRGLGSNYGTGIKAERLAYEDGVLVPTDPEPTTQRNHSLSYIERQDLKARLLTGLKSTMMNGGKVVADELDPKSLAARARRCADGSINRVSLNELYRAQKEMIEAGHVVRVEVGRRCLLRPQDGPYYPDERPWRPTKNQSET